MKTILALFILCLIPVPASAGIQCSIYAPEKIKCINLAVPQASACNNSVHKVSPGAPNGAYSDHHFSKTATSKIFNAPYQGWYQFQHGYQTIHPWGGCYPGHVAHNYVNIYRP